MPMRQERPLKKLKRSNLLGPCANIFVATDTGSWRLERPKINQDECTSCGICARFCPCDVIVVGKRGQKATTIDWRYCKGCGICANECPKKCIAMEPEGRVES